MSLTEEDLDAITQIVNRVVNSTVHNIVNSAISKSEARLVQRIDQLDDSLSMQMEQGLQEVRDQVKTLDRRVDILDDTVGRLGMQLNSMVHQLDDHTGRLITIERHLRPNGASRLPKMTRP